METEERLEKLGTSGVRAQLNILLRERDEALETISQRDSWIDEHAHLLGEYTEVRQEIDRRVAARTVL